MNNRRTFLKTTALGLGAVGLSSQVKAFTVVDQQADELKIYRKIVNLWADGSANNGVDATKPRPQIDVYLPQVPAGQKLAAILVCRGGGYAGLSGAEGAPFAEMFAKAGIAAAVITYRVAPNRYPAPYADATRAMRLLRSNADAWNIDPARIGMLGFSAGGHLTSWVTTQPDMYKDPEDDLAGKVSARPDRSMMIYPVISFLEYAHHGSVGSLLAKNQPQELLHQLSSQEHVDANTPPSFLVHAVDDPAVPVQNSLMFAEACIKNKVPLALHVYPRGGHGFAMGTWKPEVNQWPSIMMKWLEDWQFPPKTPIKN